MAEKSPEKKSESLWSDFSDALSRLKNRLIPKKTIESTKKIDVTKDLNPKNIDLQKLKKDVLKGKETHEVKSELYALNTEINHTKKFTTSKNSSQQYVPSHIDTTNWLQKNQTTRIAAPWIAKSADTLREEVKAVPLLRYFFA